jgi:hypothetical protein
MALKRKRPADQLDDPEASPAENVSNIATDDLNPFAAYNGAAPEKSSWDLDAFAPYTPGDTPAVSAAKTIDVNTAPTAADDTADDDNRQAISLDDSADFSSLTDLGFSSNALRLNSTPAPSAPIKEEPDAPLSKTPVTPARQKPEEMFDDVSFATDWSNFAPPATDTVETVEAPVVENPTPLAFASTPVDEPATPVFTQPGRFIVRIGKFSATYEFEKPEMIIGRPNSDANTSPDISIDLDDAISRKHARVYRKNDEDFIEDLGSTNGTKVNGVDLFPHSPQVLADGDVIHLGSKTEIGYYK